MIPGVYGRLLTASFIRDVFPTMPGISAPPQAWSRRLADCARQIEASLGAASSVRAVTDVALLPIVDLLGLKLVRRIEDDRSCRLELAAGDQSGLIAVAASWGQPLERVWRAAILGAVGADARWCLCCNGQVLRIVDARRTWSRDYLEFDLPLLAREAEAQSVLWVVAHADAFSGQPARLDTVVTLSRHHGVQVCRALGAGVLDALEVLLSALTRGGRQPPARLWEQSLTVLYRVLFLLFAEARGLVPLWHPLYRERYSLEAIVTVLLKGRSYKGLWRAIQAISRMAHAGCTAGELRVTAFNGRLFAPAAGGGIRQHTAQRSRHGPNGHRLEQHADQSTRRPRQDPLPRSRCRAAWCRLRAGAGVRTDTADGPTPLTRTRDIRKSSGSFYTPRAVTTFLVRRTLEPLVRGRTADEILALRVLNPAMGSGAFLVAACRYLASAAEEALIEEGRWQAHDVTQADRVALRRDDRIALPVRCRPEPDGRAVGAPLLVARNPGR